MIYLFGNRILERVGQKFKKKKKKKKKKKMMMMNSSYIQRSEDLIDYRIRAALDTVESSTIPCSFLGI